MAASLSPSSDVLLQARGIVKAFPGVRALDGVDFTLRRGEVHSLMGENGAGKSTLVKVLTGVYRPDAGEMRLCGQPIHPRSTLHAQHLGISTVYQEVNLIPYLSVAENIYLGRQPRKPWGAIDWKRLNRGAEAAMRKLELEIDVRRPLNTYSIAIQQMVAIARAVDVEARVLILDEPTSSLDKNEVAQLFTVMRRLKDQGLGIIFISHFLDQVYEISDRLTVLRNGKFVGEYLASELPRIELIAKMLGRDVEAIRQMTTHGGAAPCAADRELLLRAEKLGRKGSINPVDVDVRSGEVVGLAGLLGSGRSELARLLFGIDQPDQGTMKIKGEPVRFHSPRDAVAAGFGFVPEDRKVQSIIPSLSIRENIALALQARRGWIRRLSPAKQQELADRYIKALGIATPDADKPIGQLSGGNQQKCILARWLALNPRLLILDEPTRGIDVGAKAEIEKLTGSLCQQGMAVVFISSELEEVARTSHRVVVLRDRQKTQELEGDQINLGNILSAIAAG